MSARLKPDTAAVDSVIAGNTYALLDAFVWDQTLEGHDFWSAVHLANEPADEDLVLKLQRIKRLGQ